MKQLTVKGIKEDFSISRIAFGTGSVMKELSRDQYFALFDLFYSMGGNTAFAAELFAQNGADCERLTVDREPPHKGMPLPRSTGGERLPGAESPAQTLHQHLQGSDPVQPARSC